MDKDTKHRFRLRRTMLLVLPALVLCAAGVSPTPALRSLAEAGGDLPSLTCWEDNEGDFDDNASWGALSSGPCVSDSDFHAQPFAGNLADEDGLVNHIMAGDEQKVAFVKTQIFWSGYTGYVDGDGVPLHPSMEAIRVVGYWGWCDTSITPESACAADAWENGNWHWEASLCVENPYQSGGCSLSVDDVTEEYSGPALSSLYEPTVNVWATETYVYNAPYHYGTGCVLHATGSGIEHRYWTLPIPYNGNPADTEFQDDAASITLSSLPPLMTVYVRVTNANGESGNYFTNGFAFCGGGHVW